MNEKDENEIAVYRNLAMYAISQHHIPSPEAYAILAVVEALIKIHDQLEKLTRANGGA